MGLTQPCGQHGSGDDDDVFVLQPDHVEAPALRRESKYLTRGKNCGHAHEEDVCKQTLQTKPKSEQGYNLSC